jgi:hypothetical protein
MTLLDHPHLEQAGNLAILLSRQLKLAAIH